MANTASATRPALRKASLLWFVFMMYVYATGGSFGPEDMVTTSGPGLTLLCLLFIPLAVAFSKATLPIIGTR